MAGLRLAAVAVMTIAAGVGAASASGGISCETDDKNLALTIETGVTRGMGSPIFNFGAEATVKLKGTPDDLKQTKYEQAHLAQYWLGDGELKMVLYREREGDKPHGYVEITVRAKGDEEGYKGGYELSVFDVPATGGQTELKVKGKLECFVE